MKKYLIKALTGVLMVLALVFICPQGANAEWRQDNNGWWYADGNSYYLGWKLINGNWYYFYSDGYMASDTLIGKYYVNIDGAYTLDMPKEVTAYINKLNDKNWVNQYTLGNEINKTALLDVNKDGIKELILEYDKKGHGLAGQTYAAATYYNGNVILKELGAHGGVFGYDSSKNALFGIDGNQGYMNHRGYILENDEFKEKYIYTDGFGAGDNKCEINGTSVSTDYYNQAINSINTNYIKFY